MISLVLGMLRARRGQALVLALLAMFAVAAAVAAPAYLRAVDQAVVAGEVSAAGPVERALTVSSTVENGDSGLSFVSVAAALIGLPTFTQVSANEYPILGLETDPHGSSRLTFRQDVCAHLELTRGRCLIGEGEIVVGDATARRLNLSPGGEVSLTFAQISDDPTTPWYLPAGVPKRLTIVGVYRARSTEDTYWGNHGYFATGPDGQPSEPVFTNAATMQQMDHATTIISIDATPTADTFTVDRLDSLRTDLADLRATMLKLGPTINFATGIPTLLDRIDDGRSLAHRSVPVAAVPLVLLACFVVFLAVSYSVDGRRTELAVVSLRGTRWWVRWWLAIGESLVPILVGAVAGCLIGQALVGLLVVGQFPDHGAPLFSLDSLRYAPIAALGAILAAVFAQNRPLRSSVVELLRLVGSRRAGWQLATVEVIVCVLAAVATAQLFLSDGSLIGVGLLAPALVLIAVALVSSRLLVPLAGRYGRRALRRGRLAPALAAYSLARRPGSRRLFALLAASVAILGFAACAMDVAAQDRAVAAEVGIGAPRVLSVGDVNRQQLLTAVRTVDPQGRYAMAVSRLPSRGPDDTPRLAVDSLALGSVASWSPRFGAVDAAAVAHALRPDTADPVIVPGQDVSLDLSVSGAAVTLPVSLTVVLAPLGGSGTVQVSFGVLHDGPYNYQQRAFACASGCRLVGFHLEGGTGSAMRLSVTLRSLGTVNPSQLATDFADEKQWRLPAGGTLAGGPDGLHVDVNAPDGLAGGAWVQPADAPYPLPVVSTVALTSGPSMTGLDGRQVPIILASQVRGLPRLGTNGGFVDLEYADRLAADPGLADVPEVWLGPAAPADVVARLSQQGLVITRDVRVDTLRHQLDEQGPALALRFYLLVGFMAIVLAAGGLALVAAVDRRPRAVELAALRAQGVDYRTVRASLRWGYPALTAAAGVVGLASALIAWRLTGWAVPVFSTAQPTLVLPTNPRPLLLGVTWLAAVAVLVTVALLVGRDLRRLLRRTDPPQR